MNVVKGDYDYVLNFISSPADPFDFSQGGDIALTLKKGGYSKTITDLLPNPADSSRCYMVVAEGDFDEAGEFVSRIRYSVAESTLRHSKEFIIEVEEP